MTSAEGAQPVTTVLGAFGLGEDSERLYRQVLRQDHVGRAGHAERLGWPVDRLDDALRPLVVARLVRQNLENELVAPSPRGALSRLVERESARLDLRRRELEDAAAAVGDFSADHLAARLGAVDPASVHLIAADLLPSTIEQMLQSTQGPIRSFQLAVAVGPATDDGVERRTRQALASGRELRSVYPSAVLEHADQLAWVRQWAALGERQRVVDRVPAEFVVLGDEAVIAAPVWGAEATSAVLLRVPLLVAAFTAVFDDAWAGGLPVPVEDLEQDVGTRLLALLGTGYQDEAIARHLGLGVRTVRRRVAALMSELGVHTRFQLGVVAERRGLLRR